MIEIPRVIDHPPITDAKKNDQEQEKNQINQKVLEHHLEEVKQKIPVLRQTLIIMFSTLCIYILVGLVLRHPIWLWSVYMSPVLFVEMCLAACIFYLIFRDINISEDTYDFQINDRHQKEQSYLVLVCLFPIMFVWWPIFATIYFNIYDPFIDIRGGLRQVNNATFIRMGERIEYEKEVYQEVMVRINKDLTGYGCLSSHWDSDISEVNPYPYRYYDIQRNDTIINKLPSWMCLPHDTKFNTSQKLKIYYEKHSKTEDKKIYWQLPIKLPVGGFVMCIVLFYIQTYFFGFIILMLCLTYWNTRRVRRAMDNEMDTRRQMKHFVHDSPKGINQENILNESDSLHSIKIEHRRLSRKRRIYQNLLGLLQFVFQYQLVMQFHSDTVFLYVVSYLVVFFPCIIHLILSLFCSKYHSYFTACLGTYLTWSWECLTVGFNERHCCEKILIVLNILLLPINTILVSLLYGVVSIIMSVFHFHGKMYLSKHFMAEWDGIAETRLTIKRFNSLVNSFTCFDFFTKQILFIIYLFAFVFKFRLIANQNQSNSKISNASHLILLVINLLLCVFQVCNFLYAAYQSQFKLAQSWHMHYHKPEKKKVAIHTE